MIIERQKMRKGSMHTRWVPLLQGLYLLVTALWPLLYMRSFISFTGPKTDIWLVKTVAMLLLPYAVFCFWTALVQRPVPQIISGCIMLMCVALAGVEFYYYANGVISPVYEIDAFLQILFATWWAFHFFRAPERDD